ncbi:ROK family protein [Avibacterium paragallinarum]|uniref:ROK family protein n=1 Tax=Avibacterium paragallinarum TaxID=728 RepID=A0AAE5TIX8_AVIPA|nr:ROK family protein [Avibacterium paragallinarum]MEE3608450.1 ROK family protein [Avibacterium paragallinarum]MEE3620604.1 ROK family protein [Avibacterium paragallinarum]MEE3667888.1 ROK family protein [Avibacterium paragallinarum]MEE3680143.1 ROK family protein [Avibacterium paragallinarum]MEE4385242.1 ROK family protein [Avibacterium paragallinarum]
MIDNKELVDIKENNYRNIYKLFFENEALAKPQIAKLLGLSLPTVVHNINKLLAENKIKEYGLTPSQGGRPATAYSLIPDAFIAIGIEIQHKNIKFIALNLQGKITALEVAPLRFSHSQDYLFKLCLHIENFITQHQYQAQQILGMGISIQGIVNKEGNKILYGRVLDCEKLNIAYIQQHFSVPVKFFHDVKCAAEAELWTVKYIENAIYVSISEHLGGAIILNNHIDLGKRGYSGALEHLQIQADGKECYCGQRGCLETYCSISALLENTETLDQFFTKLPQDTAIQQRWNHYLDALAKGLNYVYLFLERDIILGGEIAQYLHQTDIIEQLQQRIRKQNPFPIHTPFIRIAEQQNNATVMGAALPFIIAYLP